MKHEISALMDGELFDDEAEVVLKRLKKNSSAQQEWCTYHLIGDALRQPDHVSEDISVSFHQRLMAEPTVFAPRQKVKKTVRYFALSAAASVMALALVAWLSVQAGNEPTPQLALSQQTNGIHPASFTASSNVNDYLMAHQEYSPSTEVHGATSYIHSVSER